MLISQGMKRVLCGEDSLKSLILLPTHIKSFLFFSLDLNVIIVGYYSFINSTLFITSDGPKGNSFGNFVNIA